MTRGILTDIGEEWLLVTDISNIAGIDVGLYLDDTNTNPTSTTDLDTAESPSLAEPNGNDYSRISDATMTIESFSGDLGFDNDSALSFSVGDSTSTVNAYFFVYNFASDVAGDGGVPQDHLIGTGSLGESRDLTALTTLKIPIGSGSNGVGLKLLSPA